MSGCPRDLRSHTTACALRTVGNMVCTCMPTNVVGMMTARSRLYAFPSDMPDRSLVHKVMARYVGVATARSLVHKVMAQYVGVATASSSQTPQSLFRSSPPDLAQLEFNAEDHDAAEVESLKLKPILAGKYPGIAAFASIFVVLFYL